MIYDEETVAVLEQTQKLVQTILTSQIFKDYLTTKQSLNNSETLNKKQIFKEKKQAFEQIAAYGKYAPEYKEKIQALHKAKKILDLDFRVAQFRKQERDLQLMLDEIVKYIARTISSDIKIDAGNPFSRHSCGGCHD